MSGRSTRRRFVRRLREEAGQVLPLTALMMVVLIGFAGLVIDIGRVWVAQRQLQNAVDATAVAVAQQMPDNYAGWSRAPSFSGVASSPNALFGYGVTAADPKITFACSPNGPAYDQTNKTCLIDTSTQDKLTPCRPGTSEAPQPAGATTCNVVTVSQSATVKSTFASLFIPRFNLTAKASASAPSQGTRPIDLVIVLDTTGSMRYDASSQDCPGAGGTGTNGRPTKLDCAKAGAQTLLDTLWPCNPGSACGLGNPTLDQVSLLIFPALTSASLQGKEEDCTQNLQSPLGDYKEYDDDQRPNVNPFTSEGYTFTVVPFENTFATWDPGSGTFVPKATDPLVQALRIRNGSGGRCGLEFGGSTSFTGVLQAAQDSLNALDDQNVPNPPLHAIVFLGDGEANYGPIYTSPKESSPGTTSPERLTPCQQAVNVARGATADGTTIYSIGWWTSNSDAETQCFNMGGKRNRMGSDRPCAYGMTSNQMTQEFNWPNSDDPGCLEPNTTGATWPSDGKCPGSGFSDPIRGCWTMYNIASTPDDFYPSASNTSLLAIFQQIGVAIGKTRLINSP